jgi:flavorubredoxin
MPVTNAQAGTRIDEIEHGLYRISTPIQAPDVPGGFSFNQFLLVDDEPLLFHCGLRRMFPLLREAIETVMPLERLRWIAFGHVEADECGAFADLLAAAPAARPLCGAIQAMLSVADMTDRPPQVLADGQSHAIGSRSLTWIDAPQVPHGWDNGFLFDAGTRTLLAGDLFTQPGGDHPPVTDGDLLGPSEAMRSMMDYYAHGPATRPTLERLAGLEPRLLACMHGASYRGDGAALLRQLVDRVAPA